MSTTITPVNQQQQTQQRGTILPQLLGTAAGIGIGGFAVGRKQEANDLLKGDKFELSQAQLDKLTAEQKTAFDNVQTALGETKDEPLKAAATEATDEYFGKGINELKTDDYLAKHGYKNADDITAQADTARKEIVTHKEAVEKAEKAVTEAGEDATKKATAEAARDAAKKALEDAEKKLVNHEFHAKVVKTAKDGIIQRKPIEGIVETVIKEDKTKLIDKGLESLKEFTKKKASWKWGGIGAAAGLVAGIIVAKMMASDEG